MKEYLIFAGVNGAGKSTFYGTDIVKKKHIPQERVNSDEILKEKGGDWKDSVEQATAMKEAVRRINEYIKKGISFNQETTLTGNSIINNIKKAKQQGYTVNVYYVGLKSADLAVERVKQRVEMGGHGISEEDIRRRYKQSLENLQKIVPLCDNVYVYDNTNQFYLVAIYKNGKLSHQKDCEWLEKYVENKENDVTLKDNRSKETHLFSMDSWKKEIEQSGNTIDFLDVGKNTDNTIDTINEKERR